MAYCKMKGKSNSNKIIATFIAILIIANMGLCFAIQTISSNEIERDMQNEVQGLITAFNNVTESEKHEFSHFIKIMKMKIENKDDPDEIQEFLTHEEEGLRETEGPIYSGIYMCYKVNEYESYLNQKNTTSDESESAIDKNTENFMLYSWKNTLAETGNTIEDYMYPNYNMTERSWYKMAKASPNSVIITPPYKTHAQDYMVQTIAMYDTTNDVIFAYDVKINNIKDTTRNGKIFENDFVIIYDNEGMILNSTDSRYVGCNLYDNVDIIEDGVDMNIDNGESASKAIAFYEFKKDVGQYFTNIDNKYGNVGRVSFDGINYRVYHDKNASGQNFALLVRTSDMLTDYYIVWLIVLLAVDVLSALVFNYLNTSRREKELKHTYELLENTQNSLKLAMAMAERAGERDPLTGLLTYQSFKKIVGDKISAMHDGDKGVFGIIDMSNVRTINEQYGQDVGDEIIKLTGNMIIGRVRNVDVVARIRGDAFALWIDNADNTNVISGIASDVHATAQKAADRKELPNADFAIAAEVIDNKGVIAEFEKRVSRKVDDAKRNEDILK